LESLYKGIRDIPDFPKKGVIFKDITPLLHEPNLFKVAIDELVNIARKYSPEAVISMDARGFIFGGILAYLLHCSFIPVRKKGKLPYKTISINYELEYGIDTLEMHEDAIRKDMNCIIVDDVLATGGTAEAVYKLVKKANGKVSAFIFLVELTFLGGRTKLEKYADVVSILKY
jgi:adenine phosphoribosyltransferase